MCLHGVRNLIASVLLKLAHKAAVSLSRTACNPVYKSAPEDGQIATIFPKRGELVAPGTPIMNLVVMNDAHVVLNIREDLMPQFKMDGTFRAEVPAIGKKDVEFRIYYISPLGSFATWKSTKQTGSYDMQTFEIHARPTQKVEGLRPGMSVLLTIDD